MRRIALYAWSSPWGLCGLLVSLALWPSEGRPRWRDGSMVTIARGPLARFMRARGWGGLTVGWSVLCWGDDRSLRHELRHVRQGLALGALFPIVYLLLLAAFGYRDNPLEVHARTVSESGL